METREYRTFDKSAWGPGPWQGEPDKVQWQDEATGLPCLAVRGPLGNWCGYVGVAEGHAAYGREYDLVEGLEVHGGLTFAGGCQEGPEEVGVCHAPEPGEPDDVWWLGFDCAHYLDLVPALPELKASAVYRTLDYVHAEATLLALQLAQVDGGA